MNKRHYLNKRLLEVHIIESNGDKWFEVFNYDSPYLGFQSDSVAETCEYIEEQLIEEI